MAKKAADKAPKKPPKIPRSLTLTCEDLPSQPEGWVVISSYMKAKHLPFVDGLDISALRNPELTVSEKRASMATICQFLSVYVFAWNWKDIDGEEYESPADFPDILGELQPMEFNWLLDKVVGTLRSEATVPKQKGAD